MGGILDVGMRRAKGEYGSDQSGTFAHVPRRGAPPFGVAGVRSVDLSCLGGLAVASPCFACAGEAPNTSRPAFDTLFPIPGDSLAGF